MSVSAGTYIDAARAYAEGVRSLAAPGGREMRERGGGGMAAADLSARAEALDPLSDKLTEVTAIQLHGEAPQERMAGSTRLLAKALADLEVGYFLFQAAQDEEAGGSRASTVGTQRGAPGTAAAWEEPLQFLLNPEPNAASLHERGGDLPQDLPSARAALTLQVDDALTLITKRATGLSELTLNGIVTLGLAELGPALAVIGGDVARALGQEDRSRRLYLQMRRFFQKAHAAIVALLGPELSKTMAGKVTEWFKSWREGERLQSLLEDLYDLDTIRREVAVRVEQSDAEFDHYISSIDGVAALDAAYGQQVELSEKLLTGLKYAALLPAVALPQGKLFAAAGYLVLGGYVIWVGSDYMDSPRLKLLDRVPGVRTIVESNLASPSQNT